MTDDEQKGMWKRLSQIIDDQIKNQIQRQVFMNGNWGQSPVVSWQPGTYTAYISPTDKDAKGMFPYQEPEQDEQGTYYGYKILIACLCGCGKLISPRYTVEWSNDGSLKSDKEPSERSMFGIHFTKRLNNPCLGEYMHNYTVPQVPQGVPVLVQCALSGTIVETEQGFRAEYAQIVGVCDGHWQSYQDYKRRSTTNPHRNPWEEEKYWKADYGPSGYSISYTVAKKRKGGSGSNDLTFKF